VPKYGFGRLTLSVNAFDGVGEILSLAGPSMGLTFEELERQRTLISQR
jgi:hypothetical protein